MQEDFRKKTTTKGGLSLGWSFIIRASFNHNTQGCTSVGDTYRTNVKSYTTSVGDTYRTNIQSDTTLIRHLSSS